MSKVLVPKELIMKYARELSPNALFIYIRLLETDWNYFYISRAEIERLTGIAPNKQKPYIQELIDIGLLEDIEDDDFEEYWREEYKERVGAEFFEGYLPFDRSDFKICQNVHIWNCEGGFIEVSKDLLDLWSVEIDGKTIELKPRAKFLLILHMILSENEGYCFAGREYLAEVLGVKKRQITNLNEVLEQSGLMKKASKFVIVGKNEVRTNNRYYIGGKENKPQNASYLAQKVRKKNDKKQSEIKQLKLIDFNMDEEILTF